jgi:hypothetical protein
MLREALQLTRVVCPSWPGGLQVYSHRYVTIDCIMVRRFFATTIEVYSASAVLLSLISGLN